MAAALPPIKTPREITARTVGMARTFIIFIFVWYAKADRARRILLHLV
jgi:hypothetical protein